MAQQIQLRNDTIVNWTNYNPVLALGEIGIELDTLKFKVGNGVDNWNTLPYTAQPDHTHSNKTLLDAINQALSNSSDVTFKSLTLSDIAENRVVITNATKTLTMSDVTATELLNMRAAYNSKTNLNVASTLVERDANNRFEVGALRVTTPIPSSVNGDFSLNTTFQSPYFYNDITQYLVRNIWVQTAVNNIPPAVTAESSLFTGNGGSGIGTLTFPAGFWVAGRTVNINIKGHIARTANSTVTVTVYLGGVALNVPQASGNITASATFECNIDIVAYSPTTFWCEGYFNAITVGNASLPLKISRQVAGGTLPTIQTVANPTTLDVRLSKGTANAISVETTIATVKIIT